MKYGLLTALLVIVAGAVAFAASQIEQNKVYSWRYKMTVEINTPEGVKSGSAVREVIITFTPRGNDEYNVDKTLKGEAIVVDLGKRGKVFAVMKGFGLGVDYGSSIPFYVFEGPPGLTIEGQNIIPS